MIHKAKTEYLLRKSYDRTKKLESFCKYEEKRFNQAQFDEEYWQRNRLSPAHANVNQETDQKVNEIKIKYGIYPRRTLKHQRSVTTCLQNKDNSTLSRQPLTDYTQKYNTHNFTQQKQYNPQRLSYERFHTPISQKNKENHTEYKIEKSVLENFPQKYDYNITFNQSVFKDIKITPTNKFQENKSNNDIKKIKTHQCKEKQQRQQIWISNLNPRIENITKINQKIKQALGNISQIKSNNIKDRQQVIGNNGKVVKGLGRYKRDLEDMVQTRVIMKDEKNYNTLKNSYIINGGSNDKQTSILDRNNVNSHSLSKNKNYQSTITNNQNKQQPYSTNITKLQQQFISSSQSKKQKQSQHNKSKLIATATNITQQNKSQTSPFIQNKQRLQKMIKLTISNISAKQQTTQKQQIERKINTYSCNKYSNVNTTNNGNNIKLITCLIKKQIELDQLLRKTKYWFKYHNDQHKEIKIKQLLCQRLSQRRHQQERLTSCNNQSQFINPAYCQYFMDKLNITDQQIDPFYSVRLQQFTYQEVIQDYFMSEDHWNQSVQQKKMIQLMIQSKWIDHVDMQRKGYATVTDLTRFINFSTQEGYHKNRDLILIFNRLTSTSNIQNRQNDQQHNYKYNQSHKLTTSSSHKLTTSSSTSSTWFKDNSKTNKLTQHNLKKLLSSKISSHHHQQ